VLHWLITTYRDALEGGPLSFLRVLLFPEFAALLATLVCFGLVLLLGPATIRWLRRMKIGDNPDFDDATMNESMAQKVGTPTMGGLLVVGVVLLVTGLLADITSPYTLGTLACLACFGLIGAWDDRLKLLRHARGGGRQGLSTRQKLVLQVVLALVLGSLAWQHARGIDGTADLYVPFLKEFSLSLPFWAYLILAVMVVVGSSNAVNLTDGLDGLASGCVALVAIGMLVLAIIIGDERLARLLLFHHVADAAPVAITCGAVVGASLGFLWWNAHPASVFLGDTGSLALGGVLGYVALVLRQELLLVILGGVFVAEAGSVLLQVGGFKLTRRLTGTGRRLFLMAPFHHGLQKRGWSETQTVVRLWLVGAMLAVLALATIKLR
jgi:phospho-N-acetylmuramoyl-pentapeptide-transferase